MSGSYDINGKCNADCSHFVGTAEECTLVGGWKTGVGLDCAVYLSNQIKELKRQSERGDELGTVATGQPYMPPSKRQDHETPWELFDMLDEEFNFTVDAAAHSRNAKISRYWTEEINGLHQDWTGETVFVNPPFAVKDLRLWTEKAYIATREPETTVVMIVPVKSDQDWWGNFALKVGIRFIKGRVTFEGNKGTFPGPIAILVFGKYIRANCTVIRIPPKRKNK